MLHKELQNTVSNVGEILSINIPHDYYTEQTEMEFEKILPIGSKLSKIEKRISALKGVEGVKIEKHLRDDGKGILLGITMTTKSESPSYFVYFVIDNSGTMTSINSGMSSFGTVGDYDP